MNNKEMKLWIKRWGVIAFLLLFIVGFLFILNGGIGLFLISLGYWEIGLLFLIGSIIVFIIVYRGINQLDKWYKDENTK